MLLNIFVAIVLDTYSLASRLYAVEANKKNPMIVACIFDRSKCRSQKLAKVRHTECPA